MNRFTIIFSWGVLVNSLLQVKANLVEEMRRIMEFLGLPVNKDRLDCLLSHR